VPVRGHPSGPPVRPSRAGQRGLAVRAVRVRQRVRLGPGHQPPPVDPAVRPVQFLYEAGAMMLAQLHASSQSAAPVFFTFALKLIVLVGRHGAMNPAGTVR
jgi:hypothetical protein